MCLYVIRFKGVFGVECDFRSVSSIGDVLLITSEYYFPIFFVMLFNTCHSIVYPISMYYCKKYFLFCGIFILKLSKNVLLGVGKSLVTAQTDVR